MPRNKYPEETVEKILDVSLKLFLEKGYEETTILDIVNHLGGLTRGAFYHHFKSKEEVLNALNNKLFFENNPFKIVSNEKNLSGLDKIKKVIKLQYSNKEQHNVSLMAIPLLNNPRILASYIESNQRIVVPYIEKLFQEAINDGSIENKNYPKALSSFFMMITELWFIPSIFPGTKEELLERLLFAKELFDKLEIPIIDDEIMFLAKNTLEKLN